MTVRPLVFAALVAVAATACNRADEAPTTEPAAPVEAAVDATPSTPAPMQAADAPKPEGTFSAAALAGRYEGEGILLLNADGTFNYTIGDATDEGTWAAEPTDSTRVRLDPNSKTVQDKVLQIVSNDELKPVAGDNAMTPSSDQPFKRTATP